MDPDTGVMAKYVGETIRISTTATDFDGDTALEDGDLATIEVTIYDSAGDVLTGPHDMDWDADHSHWAYDWDTNAVDAGTYRLKVRVATGSTENWEFGRVQLKSNPV